MLREVPAPASGEDFPTNSYAEVEDVSGRFLPSLCERFWLCDKCCKEMTLVWGGTAAKIVPLPPEPVAQPPALKVDATQTQEELAATAAPQRR